MRNRAPYPPPRIADALHLSTLRRALTLPVIALLCLGLVGCAKAPPARSAGFVDARVMAHDPNLPFHQAWRQPETRWQNYTRVYVAEVDTAHLLSTSRWQQGARKAELVEDVRRLAVYTRAALVRALRDDPAHRFTVLEAPLAEPDVLLVEVAITELVPSKVSLNLLGYAPFGAGVALRALRTMAKDRSTVAIEAKIRDASTGEVLLMLADREADQLDPLGVRGLTWYSHAHRVITQWSRQMVLVLSRGPETRVKDTRPFTLKPW